MTKITRLDRLAAHGIRSGVELAEWVRAPAMIHFFVRDTTFNRKRLDYRTELHYGGLSGAGVGQYNKVEIFRLDRIPQSISVIRRRLLNRAYCFAEQELGIPAESWSRTAFNSCWLPRESIEAMVQKMQDGTSL